MNWPQEVSRVWGIIRLRWFMLEIRVGLLWGCAAVYCSMLCVAAQAGPVPVVNFDVARTVACRDVTTDDYRRKYPGSSLIEIVIDVSPRLVSGSEKDIKELVIEIVSPGDRLSVRAYLPTSQLTSDIVGEVIHLQQTEVEGQISLEYSAVLPKSGEAHAGARVGGARSEMLRAARALSY